MELPRSVLHDFATEFVDTRTYPNDESLDVGFNGFAKMTLSGEGRIPDYVDLKGRVVFSEVWTVDWDRFVRLTAQAVSETPSAVAVGGRSPMGAVRSAAFFRLLLSQFPNTG